MSEESRTIIGLDCRICAALGLDPHKVQRLVLVFDVDEAVQLYVKEIVNADQAEKVARVLESAEPRSIAAEVVSDVVVDDNGNVFVAPMPGESRDG